MTVVAGWLLKLIEWFVPVLETKRLERDRTSTFYGRALGSHPDTGESGGEITTTVDECHGCSIDHSWEMPA